MSDETLQFYASIGEVILKIHFYIRREKQCLDLCKSREICITYTDSLALLISFVCFFFMNYINRFRQFQKKYVYHYVSRLYDQYYDAYA